MDEDKRLYRSLTLSHEEHSLTHRQAETTTTPRKIIIKRKKKKKKNLHEP